MIIRIYFLIAVLSIFVSCRNDNDYIKPEKRIINEIFDSKSNIVPFNRTILRSNSYGVIQHLHFKVGDTIAAGDKFITLQNTNSKETIDFATNQYQRDRDNLQPNSPLLRNLYDRLIVVQKKYELDSLNYYRYKLMSDKESFSKASTTNFI